MLEYLGDMMEDAQEKSWASAKAAHAVILCRMEEGKLTWSDTQGLDRLRRAHAQKILTTSSYGNGSGKKFEKSKEGFDMQIFSNWVV